MPQQHPAELANIIAGAIRMNWPSDGFVSLSERYGMADAVLDALMANGYTIWREGSHVEGLIERWVQDQCPICGDEIVVRNTDGYIAMHIESRQTTIKCVASGTIKKGWIPID